MFKTTVMANKIWVMFLTAPCPNGHQGIKVLVDPKQDVLIGGEKIKCTDCGAVGSVGKNKYNKWNYKSKTKHDDT